MIMNFLLGLPMMVLCLLLQTAILVFSFRYYFRNNYAVNSTSFASSMIIINIMMIILVVSNLGQIAIWAYLFRWLGEFGSFKDAFYHSAVNFASLGYGDIVMSEKHRLLGAIEAINGVLMMGVSTAVLMIIFQNITKKLLKSHKEQLDKQ